MSGIYAGSTPKYYCRIRDENGVQLDPDDALQIIDIRIWIYNSITGAIVAKFYLNNAVVPSDGWRQATVKTITVGDNRVMFTLTAEETKAAPTNKNEIQIEVTVPDADFDNNQRIIIKTGRFGDIKPMVDPNSYFD